MHIPMNIEPASGAPPGVHYRWDPDTEILIATLDDAASGEGLSGTVELQGSDGSWLNLDLAQGRIHAVEIAVWPEVRTRAALAPPTEVEDVAVTVPTRRAQQGLASVEVDTPLVAEADSSERTIHFRLGPFRRARTVRLARDILLDLDPAGQLAGLWLLNVPPLPEAE
ncbi:MAG TPA: hypothetical protein VMM18_08000 [Gemmatimonadaceae bacterium]|nr:hypothetical protein [Gemmatimonadaceae bacterium]